MNAPTLFKSNEFGDLRVIRTENGEPLFCASDITTILGYKNGRKAITDNCNPKGVTHSDTPTSGGIQWMTYINEPNLYRLIMRSKLPDAEKFQDWVCEEVLPAIRKDGGYIATKEDDTPDVILARAVLLANKTIEGLKARNELLEFHNQDNIKRLKDQEPKVEYYDEVLQAKEGISTTIIAKDLGMSAEALNKLLHKHNVIFKSQRTWVLYSKYADRGYTITKTYTRRDSEDNPVTEIHTYWTEAGRKFIMDGVKKIREGSKFKTEKI